jgi:branched-chain amino acid transport system permease protein
MQANWLDAAAGCGHRVSAGRAQQLLLTVMTLAFIFAIATLGLNLLTGYTGQLNLAHGGFMAIGAYTLGILTVDQMPFWLAFVLSGVVCVVLGYVSAWCRCASRALLLDLHAVRGLHHLSADREVGADPRHGGPDRHPGPGFDRSARLRQRAGAVLPRAGLPGPGHIRHASHRQSLLGRSFMAVRNSDALAERSAST